MMEWHVNDLSIDGQFKDYAFFKETLQPLLKLRATDSQLHSRLFCSQNLSRRKATASKNVQDAVLGTGDRNFISLALAWLSKGPFWDDSRQDYENDIFSYHGEDVTDQGLGESSRRIMSGFSSSVFSFSGSRFSFEETPLNVLNGIEGESWGECSVANYWHLEQICSELERLRTQPPALKNWQEVCNEAKARYAGLIFSHDVMESLKSTPFSCYVAERILKLLNVLNIIVKETDEKGKLLDQGMELVDKHFVGSKAWFTDESKTNKSKFENQLKFSDPESSREKIFCPWHGKIKVSQIRIHFEWPRPDGQKKIKVPYIGHKITKN